MPTLFGTRSSSAIALILVVSTMAVESLLLLLPRSSPRPMTSPLETKGQHQNNNNHNRGGTGRHQQQCQRKKPRATSATTITSLSFFPFHSSDTFGVSVSRREDSPTLAPKPLARSTGALSTSARYASRRQSSRVILQSSEKNDNDNNSEDRDENDSVNGDALVGYVGVACQPVVWASLYLVATTGGGFPAGPGGLLGALEGVSYLAVVAFALVPSSTSLLSSTATNLSRITIGVGLVVLAGLVADQGCVPNAKPILDYSAYLPICNSE